MFLPKNMKHKKPSSNCNYLKEKKMAKCPLPPTAHSSRSLNASISFTHMYLAQSIPLKQHSFATVKGAR